MVDLSIWYGAGAALLVVGAVAFVAFAAFRGDLTSPYYSLPPLQALFGAVSYAVIAFALLGRMTQVAPETLRFVVVFLTLPVAVYYLGLLGGASVEHRITAVVLTLAVVAAAYLTTVTGGRLRVGLAALAGVMLVALVRALVRTFTPAAAESSLFLSLRDLTVATVLAYLVVYLLGPMGTGTLVAADFGFVHLVVAVVFSLGFLVLVAARTYEIEATTSETAAPG